MSTDSLFPVTIFTESSLSHCSSILLKFHLPKSSSSQPRSSNSHLPKSLNPHLPKSNYLSLTLIPMDLLNKTNMYHHNDSSPPSFAASFNGDKAIQVGIAFIPILTFFVVLRYISRYVGKVPTGLDDWLILPAFATNLTLNSLSIGKDDRRCNP